MKFSEQRDCDGLRRTRGLLGWWGASGYDCHANGEEKQVSGFVADLHTLLDQATSNLARAQHQGHGRFAQTAVQALRARTAVEARETELLLLYVIRESVADQIGILDQLSHDLAQRAESLVDRTNCSPDGNSGAESPLPKKRGTRQATIEACGTQAV